MNLQKSIFEMSNLRKFTLWVWPHVGERAKCQKSGVCHATFGYGRPSRSVGPLTLAAEIVSIGYGPVPHRIWGPGAGRRYPSHVLKRHQDRLTLLTDVTRSFPTTTAASHSLEKQLKLRQNGVEEKRVYLGSQICLNKSGTF